MIDFAVEKSLRYHQRMRGYYESSHKIMTFLIFLCGSSVLAGGGRYFGAAAAIFAAIELVWGLSHLARDHGILHRRFSDLAISIRTTPPKIVIKMCTPTGLRNA